MIVIFLANTSTANPVFSSSSGKINGQDPSVFSDVHEIPTLSGLGEKITPQLTNKVFPPGVELPGGGVFCNSHTTTILSTQTSFEDWLPNLG